MNFPPTQEQLFEEMLNEAIIQSLLEQDKAQAAALHDEELTLDIPNDNDDQILKEVMKLSALEHQK